MSVYACWFKNGGWIEHHAPAKIGLDRTLLVADGEPSASMLHRWLAGIPRVIVLPAPPRTPLPGVRYHTFAAGTNPLCWERRVDEAIEELGIDTMVSHPQLLGGQTLLRLPRLGLRRLVLLGGKEPRVTSPGRLALRRLLARGWQTLCRPMALARRLPEPDAMTVRQCQSVLELALPRPVPPDPGAKMRIAQFVTSLNSGGAERQGCYAAALQKQHGHNVRVLCRVPLRGHEDHYRFLLEPTCVPVREIGEWHERFLDLWRQRGVSSEALRRLPAELRDPVVDLVGELLLDPVDVLHCYVDDCNIVGAIAGCLAGVPAMVLSFRNGNPSRFPGLHRPWMLPWYHAVLGRPGVVLSANSSSGARDYESWLGLPTNSVPVVRNAFVPSAMPGPVKTRRWRRELGIEDAAPVVAGIFRLHREKRPLFFLECIAALRPCVPGLRVVMAGVGPLEEQVRRRIGELGLHDVVLMLGQRKDIPLILAGSDVLLLTSEWEGTPNVLLEAQHSGCVPVVTDAGGASEAVDSGTTAVVVGLDDKEGIVQSVTALLSNAERRQQMAASGRAFVTRQFAPETLYEANQRLYTHAFKQLQA